MRTWQLQDAKSHFSRVVDLALTESPQLVTRNGKPVVYIVSAEDYRITRRPSLKTVLADRPHREVSLDLERDSDTMRDIDL